jgi:hypothetical protein
VVDGSSWQERYDESIREHDEAVKRTDANRSTREKIGDRSMVTGTVADLVIFPFVALVHGVSALVKRRRGRSS